MTTTQSDSDNALEEAALNFCIVVGYDGEPQQDPYGHHCFKAGAQWQRSRDQAKWIPGFPDHVYGSEWFFAKLKNGSIAALIALPDEYFHQYKTADETYFTKDWVVAWMQVPDSDFIPFKKEALKC